MARLGQLLVRADLVSENNLARALGIQHFAGGRLGTLLLERGSIDEDSLGKTLALQHGCEYIPWRMLSDIPPEVVAMLPAKFAIKHAAVPYERGESYLKLALRDPGDLRILDELFFVTGRKIIAGVAPEVRIYQALEKYFGERRTPRYAILAEKLSRPQRAAARASAGPPPPPEFFPSPRRRTVAPPGPQEIWGEVGEPDLSEPPIIQSWRVPDQEIGQSLGGWAGTVSPGMEPPPVLEPESISWEEMPAIPAMWVPESVPSPSVPREASSAEAAKPAEASAARPRIEAPPPIPPPLPIRESAVASPLQMSSVSRVAEAVGPSSVAPLEGEEPAPSDTAPHPVPPLAASIEAAPPPATPPAPVQAEAAAIIEEVPAPPLLPSAAPLAAPVASASAGPLPSALDFPHVTSATDRDAIATAALDALSRRFVRAAILVTRSDLVRAWGAAGNGVSTDALGDISIPWTEPSVFLNIRHSRSFYLGPLPPLPRHESIAIAMGGWAEECLVQPIFIKEKPVAFLYAEFTRDRGATPMDLAYMRELAGAASVAFVSAIRLKKKEI